MRNKDNLESIRAVRAVFRSVDKPSRRAVAKLEVRKRKNDGVFLWNTYSVATGYGYTRAKGVRVSRGSYAPSIAKVPVVTGLIYAHICTCQASSFKPLITTLDNCLHAK